MAEGVTALVLEAPRRFDLRELPRPAVREDTGILRVDACGLCGTDHEQYTGALHPGRPFVPGHEVVGTVEELGPVAAERWGVAVGDRVAVEVFLGCGACDACRLGELRRCARHGLRTMYGLVGLAEGSGLNGGYATHLELRADSLLLPVPPALDPALATVFNPLGRRHPLGRADAGHPARRRRRRPRPGHPGPVRRRRGQGRRCRVRDGDRRRRS